MQAVERCGADKNKGDLDKLGGLEADRTQHDPVLRAVYGGADGEVQCEEQKCADRNDRAAFHHAIEVAYKPYDQTEQHDADQKRRDLHFDGIHALPADQQNADAAEQQTEGLRLKADTPQQPSGKQVQHPFGEEQNAEHGERVNTHFTGAEHELQRHGELHEHNAEHQAERGSGLARKAGENAALLYVTVRCVFEDQRNGSDPDLVADLHERRLLDRPAAYPYAEVGVRVRNEPALLTAQEHGVVAGDGLVRNDDVAAFAAAYGIFPVQNGERRAGGGVLKHDNRVLSSLSLSEGRVAAPQNEQCNKRRDEADEQHQRREQAGVQYAHGKILKYIGHSISPFSFRGYRRSPQRAYRY